MHGDCQSNWLPVLKDAHQKREEKKDAHPPKSSPTCEWALPDIFSPPRQYSQRSYTRPKEPTMIKVYYIEQCETKNYWLNYKLKTINYKRAGYILVILVTNMRFIQICQPSLSFHSHPNISDIFEFGPNHLKTFKTSCLANLLTFVHFQNPTDPLFLPYNATRRE